MSGFIANAGVTPPSTDITSGNFWPAVNLEALRKELRIDGTVTNERLRAAAVAAIIDVNDDLDEWRGRQEAAGYTALADVPAPQVDGRSRQVVLYLRAVACATAAEVTERYRSFDASGAGDRKADALTPSIDELRRDLRFAIRDFLRVRRVTVELI